eukprot:1159178-Pelagomonas_calceolata.AAC.2
MCYTHEVAGMLHTDRHIQCHPHIGLCWMSPSGAAPLDWVGVHTSRGKEGGVGAPMPSIVRFNTMHGAPQLFYSSQWTFPDANLRHRSIRLHWKSP